MSVGCDNCTLKVRILNVRDLRNVDKMTVILPRPPSKCPFCGGRLTYIPSLKTYYCFNCKKYVY